VTEFECLSATVGLLFATFGIIFFVIMLVCRIGDTVAGNNVQYIMGNFDDELRELLDPVVSQPHQGPGGGSTVLTT
jgi:hypothetical protein